MVPSSLHKFELFRDGIGLLPSPFQGSAIWVRTPDGNSLRTCTCDQCKKNRKKTCASLLALGEGIRVYQEHFPAGWQSRFESSIWYRLAHAVYADSQVGCDEVKVQRVGEDGSSVRFLDPEGRELARLLDAASPGASALLERTGKMPRGEVGIDRSEVIERLRLFQLTDQERAFEKAGMRSRRQAWDGSFWNRLAYHWTREMVDASGRAEGSFHPAIDKGTGDFTITHRLADGSPTVRITVPRKRVAPVLRLLSEHDPHQEDLQIHPVPLRSIFRITAETELDMRVRPVIRLMQQTGEEKFLDREELKKFQYGNLVYIKELGVLAELEKERKARKFAVPRAMKLARGQVPSFLDDHVDALEDGSLVLEEPLRGLRVHKTYDRVEIDGERLEERQGWYRLSVEYGFGEHSVDLAEILRARRTGAPYLEAAGGWIDLRAPAFEALEALESKGESDGDGLEMSIGEVLRFQAEAEQPLKVGRRRGDWLRRLLDREPSEPYRAPEGFRSELRDYQTLGVDWLRFLGEHGIGGLLCDDMGLGKTHQSMALMASMAAEEPSGGPFLVVAPTSVVSHWRDKIRHFAPKLVPRVYHGPDRRLGSKMHRRHVVLTSYGVLRNDIDRLLKVPWSAAIFDEIQYLKNRSTRAYAAAAQLPVAVKLGLTGTPIENSLGELKNLFDLVVPGYLGSDDLFFDRFERSVTRGSRTHLDQLRRLIAPFILRRLKASVLDELPAKIEDVRSCELSPEQVGLYRQAISDRGRKLVAQLEDRGERLPYLHVFALLDLLKQICNHPALVAGDLDPGSHASGKWELFLEILRESLDAGEKVVVFSQYLGMLEMMSRHLEAEQVEHVRLVGSTAAKDRGTLIERFNTDDTCRVFLGSLKAGGTGIDLVGGSVVIHYDRWWNAAREDQATDRVHRMGQKKVVQVFKLVTEGTLEEKIARMIEAKRDLLDEVVQEDDPRMAKHFSREDLLDLLQEV